jgi:hypothetical protein
VFALIVCTIILELPESPRWLVKMERHEEARDVINCLYGDIDDAIDQADFEEVLTAVSSTGQFSWSALVDNQNPTKNRHRLILGLVHAILHQICGINLVIITVSGQGHGIKTEGMRLKGVY